MQSKPIYARAVRGIVIAAMLTVAAAGSAVAAGPGYGGGGGTPPPVTPVGFSTVLTAQTVTKHGVSFSVKYAKGTIGVKVPKNATKNSIQIAITKGNNSTVKKSLPSSLKNYKILSSFGIQVRKGSSATSTTKSVTITVSASNIKKGDVVLVYSSKTGKFTKLAGVTAQNGKVTFKLKKGQSLAIAAPPKKS